jgi:hypothetical protein
VAQNGTDRPLSWILRARATFTLCCWPAIKLHIRGKLKIFFAQKILSLESPKKGQKIVV